MQRFRLRDECISYPMIPPPLCAILYPLYIIQKVRLISMGHPICGNPDEDPGTLRRLVLEFISEWECAIAADYYRENKDKEKWPVPRRKSETANSLDEDPWVKYAIQQLRNQMIILRNNSSYEADMGLGEEERTESTDANDTTEENGTDLHLHGP